VIRLNFPSSRTTNNGIIGTILTMLRLEPPQGVKEIMNPTYTPITTEDKALFAVKQTYEPT
jgi:hypothetical protein